MMFSDLPWDLESEILSRVPPTSLSTLRSTCKAWYALFKDPKFIMKNLSKAASQQVILRKDRNVYSVRIDLHGINNNFDPSIEFKGKLTSLENSEYVKAYEISQCDGLLLCATYKNRLVVLNPCTGQARWIQPNNYGTCYYDHHFIGYKNNNKSFRSYKILRLNPISAELYEFNSDSWKALDDITLISSIKSNGVTLKGNAYWFASVRENPFAKFILMFDFTTERFGRLSLPFQSDGDNRNVVLSVVRDEKLALLHHKFHQYFDVDDSLKMKIWVTNTKNIDDQAKDLSWSNFLVVDFGKFMITDIFHVISFLVDEENKMVVCSVYTKKNKTRIYIVGKEVHKRVHQEFLLDHPQLLSYSPSLIQIPGR